MESDPQFLFTEVHATQDIVRIVKSDFRYWTKCVHSAVFIPRAVGFFSCWKAFWGEKWMISELLSNAGEVHVWQALSWMLPSDLVLILIKQAIKRWALCSAKHIVVQNKIRNIMSREVMSDVLTGFGGCLEVFAPPRKRVSDIEEMIVTYQNLGTKSQYSSISNSELMLFWLSLSIYPVSSLFATVVLLIPRQMHADSGGSAQSHEYALGSVSRTHRFWSSPQTRPSPHLLASTDHVGLGRLQDIFALCYIGDRWEVPDLSLKIAQVSDWESEFSSHSLVHGISFVMKWKPFTQASDQWVIEKQSIFLADVGYISLSRSDLERFLISEVSCILFSQPDCSLR